MAVLLSGTNQPAAEDMDRLRAELQRAGMKAVEAADLLRRIKATMTRVEATLDRMAEDRRPRP
jgi:site-specific recombinase